MAGCSFALGRAWKDLGRGLLGHCQLSITAFPRFTKAAEVRSGAARFAMAVSSRCCLHHHRKSIAITPSLLNHFTTTHADRQAATMRRVSTRGGSRLPLLLVCLLSLLLLIGYASSSIHRMTLCGWVVPSRLRPSMVGAIGRRASRSMSTLAMQLGSCGLLPELDRDEIQR